MSTVVAISESENEDGYLFPSIDGFQVEMGEDGAGLDTQNCSIHGSQYHISGSNQGGHDGMSVCLKCCALIYEHMAPPSGD